MKVTISQETLARALSTVGRAVKGSSTLPVLSNILISAENGRLRFSATDLEIGITCLVDATIEKPGAVTVPAKTIADLVGTLTKDQVILILDEATQTLTVKSGRSKTEVKGIAASEFPPLPKTATSGIELPAASLKDAVLQVAPASADDESRPTLTGIHLRLAGGVLTLEAADGFRMSQVTIKVDQSASAQAIIPARSLEELARLANTGSVTVFLDSNRVIFRLNEGNIEIAAQLIEGLYPDLNQIVPKSFKTCTVVSTAALQKAVKQAEIFARSGRQVVTLDVTPANGVPGSLKLTGESDETGRVETAVEATVAGAPIKIAFNPRFLAEALKTVKTEQVALETNAETLPGVIRPVGAEGCFHILMPMHLS